MATSSKKKRFYSIEWFVMTLIRMMVTVGCDQLPGQSLIPKSLKKDFYSKMRLKASDFFADSNVLNLCKAIEVSDLEKIESLVKGGVDVNTHGKENVTPLFWAFPDNKLDRFNER